MCVTLSIMKQLVTCKINKIKSIHNSLSCEYCLPFNFIHAHSEFSSSENFRRTDTYSASIQTIHYDINYLLNASSNLPTYLLFCFHQYIQNKLPKSIIWLFPILSTSIQCIINQITNRTILSNSTHLRYTSLCS